MHPAVPEWVIDQSTVNVVREWLRDKRDETSGP
jgi:hypothetical protein